MSYSRVLDEIERDIEETSKNAPCEASYLMLMRGMAKGWAPNAEVSELILDEFNGRIQKVYKKSHDEYCAELTKTPFNLIQTVNAMSIGSAAHYFGTQKATKQVELGSNFLKNYQSGLERCRGSANSPTRFFSKLDEDGKQSLHVAIQAANTKHENLDEFQKMHIRCMKE